MVQAQFEFPVRSSDAGRRSDGTWRELLILVGLFLMVWLLWDSWLIFPIKLLVVFFHELSHGLVALLTGGSIVRIEMVAEQGGVCVTAGGSRFWTLSAGYLGSLAWGGSILFLAARTNFDRWLQTVLGIMLAAAALIWVRPLVSFGFGFALLAGLSLSAMGVLISGAINDLLLRMIGLTSVLYAVIDIKSDILDRPHLLESDAAQLARLTGIPTLFWGVLWMLIALGAAALILVLVFRPAKSAGS